MKSALIRLLEQKKIPLKICLFIDGLDEYEGNHLEIAELFQFVAEFEHVKVCVSSRPLLVFDRFFKSYPGLILQILTNDDIKKYVRYRLSTNERMKESEYEEPTLATLLASKIVSKASGVFLWVKFVAHSLLEGLGHYDRGADLKRRLQDLPEDLEDLYWHMLNRVKPAGYLEETFRLLLTVENALHPFTILQLTLAEMQDSQLAVKSKQNEIAVDRQLIECEGVVGWIKSRCLGLIEISGSKAEALSSRRVQILHKSLSDFLNTPKAQSRIAQCLGAQGFVLELHLMRSALLKLKTVEQRLLEYDFHRSGGVKREAWFDHVRPIVMDFMHYARMTEEKTNIARIALVDEVDRVTTTLWESVSFKSDAGKRGFKHWFIATRKPGPGEEDQDGLHRDYPSSKPKRWDSLVAANEDLCSTTEGDLSSRDYTPIAEISLATTGSSLRRSESKGTSP